MAGTAITLTLFENYEIKSNISFNAPALYAKSVDTYTITSYIYTDDNDGSRYNGWSMLTMYFGSLEYSYYNLIKFYNSDNLVEFK